MKDPKAALGGTFDHLHSGHKFFLKTAFSYSKNITIGLSSDELVAKLKLNFNLQPYKKRKKQLTIYLRSQNLLKYAKIITLKTPFGPPATTPSYKILFATKNTLKNAQKINRLRKKNNLLPLKIIQIPLKTAKDGKIICSKDIRKGLRNRFGTPYKKLFTTTLTLTSSQRNFFKKPLGKILKNPPKLHPDNLVILVGDLALKRFLKTKTPFNIAVFDLKIQRKPHRFFSKKFISKADFKAKNKPGTISKTAADKVLKSIKKKKGLIYIKGEEDLTAVPAILLSPLNSLVFYGQPKKGLVKIRVTEEIKEKLFNLFS